MNYDDIFTSIAHTHGGIIETRVAAEHGVSKAMLSKLCKQGKLHRISRGQYILPEDVQDELYSISLRGDALIFSHETALFLHGISDRTPFEHTLTVPSGHAIPLSVKAECKVYFIKPELFELGRTTVKTPFGNDVPCYDLDRTICDVIRSRNKIGPETFLSALRMYARNPKKNLNRLIVYAKQLRVAGVLRQYLEVLL